MKVSQKKYLIKSFFFIFLMNILLACSSLNSERIAPAMSGAFESIKGALFGYPDLIISREVINRIPYASALLKIGKGSQGLIILESTNSDSYIWVSKDNVYLKTRHGRIVQTAGLFNNLTNLTLPNQIFEEVLNDPEAVRDYLSYYSYDQPYLLDLQVEVSIVNKGQQEIKILGEVKKLILIEESISNKEIRWTAKNLFWVDPEDHYVWKSIQYISPKLPSFTFQITKRPST